MPWVRAGVGAVATQATTAVRYGPEGLDLLESGKTPADTIDSLLKDDANRESRQLGIIDIEGRTAAFTGKQNGTYAGSRQGKNYTVQGNLLVGPQVIDAVADRFEATDNIGMALADRLIAALEAGQVTGGDKRKGRTQSAALLVADANRDGVAGDHIVETLQVAEHPEPVGELRRQYDTIHQRLGYREFSIVRGTDVIELKRMLHALRILWPDTAEFPNRVEKPDLADYDEPTAAAVDRFRQSHGLPVPADELGHPAGLVDRVLVEALRAAYYNRAKEATPAPASESARSQIARRRTTGAIHAQSRPVSCRRRASNSPSKPPMMSQRSRRRNSISPCGFTRHQAILGHAAFAQLLGRYLILAHDPQQRLAGHLDELHVGRRSLMMQALPVPRSCRYHNLPHADRQGGLSRGRQNRLATA